MPGVMVYGATRDSAIAAVRALALRVALLRMAGPALLRRIEQGTCAPTAYLLWQREEVRSAAAQNLMPGWRYGRRKSLFGDRVFLQIDVFQTLPLGQFNQSGIVDSGAPLQPEFLHFVQRTKSSKAVGVDRGEPEIEHAQVLELVYGAQRLLRYAGTRAPPAGYPEASAALRSGPAKSA